MQRTVRTMMLGVVLPILSAGCQTMATGETSVCAQWKGITWSQQDTIKTIDEVKSNNARRKAWCVK